jgi:hypothetical protein
MLNCLWGLFSQEQKIKRIDDMKITSTELEVVLSLVQCSLIQNFISKSHGIKMIIKFPCDIGTVYLP